MSTYLEKKVEYFDKEYRAGRSLITDKSFDQLEANLFRVNPNSDYFNRKNKLALPSLEKGDYKGFLDGLLPDTRLLIQPKIDCCAIAIKYIDGKLEKAISRKGVDVTNKIEQVKDVPKEINIRSSFMVRGELFTEQEAPRNSQRIASGYLRSGHDQPNPKISFCSFQIINTKTNEYQSLVYCRELGFTIPKFVEANRTSQVETYRQAWLNGKLFNEYPTDGIVIKINSRKLQLIRESNMDEPLLWQYAIKY